MEFLKWLFTSAVVAVSGIFGVHLVDPIVPQTTTDTQMPVMEQPIPNELQTSGDALPPKAVPNSPSLKVADRTLQENKKVSALSVRLTKDKAYDLGSGYSVTYSGNGTGQTGSGPIYQVAFVFFSFKGSSNFWDKEGFREGETAKYEQTDGGKIVVTLTKIYADAIDVSIQITPASSLAPLSKLTFSADGEAELARRQSALTQDGQFRITIDRSETSMDGGEVSFTTTLKGVTTSHTVKTGKAVTVGSYVILIASGGETTRVIVRSKPEVDLKVNDSDGPITIQADKQAKVSWVSKGVESCNVWGAGIQAGTVNNLASSRNGNALTETLVNDTQVTVECGALSGVEVRDSVAIKVSGATTTPYKSGEISSSETAQRELRDNRRVSDTYQLMSALSSYKDTYGQYPLELSLLVSAGLLSAIPADPLDGSPYAYDLIHTDLYELGANLETANHRDLKNDLDEQYYSATPGGTLTSVDDSLSCSGSPGRYCFNILE